MENEWNEEEFLKTFKHHAEAAIEAGCDKNLMMGSLDPSCPFVEIRDRWKADVGFRQARRIYMLHKTEELKEKMMNILKSLTIGEI